MNLRQTGDEFASLTEVADELGLPNDHIPRVQRRTASLGDERQLSAIQWGEATPEVVLLHGGGQNAHTWDLVLLGLGRPAIAIDLPGHGHSSWRRDRNYGPVTNAAAVGTAIEQLAPDAAAVIGMSLGGLTTIRLAASRPDLVRRAVVIDVTPSVSESMTIMTKTQQGSVALVQGPRTFAGRDEMIAAAIAASPTRPASAVARGVVHNTHQLDNGTWAWRYDLANNTGLMADFGDLWDDVTRIQAPTMLVRGGNSAFVSDAHTAEFIARLPRTRVETVPGAGHSVQSDQPAALTTLIEDFLTQ